MYDAVLIPTDGSEGVAETLDHGLELAACHDATVHTLYVVDRRQYYAAPDDARDEVLETLREEGEAAVEAVRDRVADRGLASEDDIREGVPHKTILEYVAEEEIDVVVMGTHGRTGRDRIVHLGSVTERVVKNATVPIFVVNIGEPEDPGT